MAGPAAGPGVQEGRHSGDRDHHHLDGEGGPVAAAVVVLGDHVPDPGRDQHRERRPGDPVELPGGRPGHVAAEAAQRGHQRRQGQLAAHPDGGRQHVQEQPDGVPGRAQHAGSGVSSVIDMGAILATGPVRAGVAMPKGRRMRQGPHPVRVRPLSAEIGDALQRADVLRLRALLALGDVELDPLVLIQAPVAVSGDGRVVDEDVCTPPWSSGAMKPKPFSALNHLTVPCAMSFSLLMRFGGHTSWPYGLSFCVTPPFSREEQNARCEYPRAF